MAAQILYGRMNNKEISFAPFDETINLTDYLKKVCSAYFIDDNFLEDGEELTYPVVYIDRISSFLAAELTIYCRLFEKKRKTE